jgi:NAD(P)-dependent dehydrogenase (short-subunit alcohol dehydrogenase family)
MQPRGMHFYKDKISFIKIDKKKNNYATQFCRRSNDMIIFITGTNKGLGLEFVKQYLMRGETVIAACRNPHKATILQDLQKTYNNKLTIVQLEVRDENSRNEAYEEVKKKFHKIDLLINNAGIRSGGDKRTYLLGELNQEDIYKVFDVNSISPLLISEKMLDLIEKGQNPKIIHISSRLGSIGARTSVFGYSYCASKAALNMFTKLMSIELKDKEVTILSMHPGHVKTDLGGPHAPIIPEQSVKGMIKVIDSINLEDTGQFFDWQGNKVPW